MNSLWIQRISDYARSPLALDSAKHILLHKMQQQSVLLAKYNIKRPIDPADVFSTDSIRNALLYEGRFANAYWKQIRHLISNRTNFTRRSPRSTDPANRLLDIGYHHLTNKLTNLFKQHDICPAIGLFHRARSRNSAPLVYDLLELFRANTVDAEMIRFFHLKKKPVRCLTDTDISKFLARLNRRLEKTFYIRTFHACRSYNYYMELQLLRFSKAVREKRVFVPWALPNRHEDRCSESGY